MKRQRNPSSVVFDPTSTTKKAPQRSGIRIFRPFVLSFLLAFLFARAAYADEFKLKVIAINDFHGNLQSPGKFQADPRSSEVPAGGIDVLAGYIRNLKKQSQFNVVVSAGDLIGASPLVSALFHDEGTIETMNRLGLEISSVGNHEFDKGTRELLRMQSGGCSTADKNTCKGAQVGTRTPFGAAKFQYLAANVVDQATGKTIFPAYAIKKYNGIRVAFIGLTLKGTPAIVNPAGITGLRFDDEASTINARVRELRAKGVRSFIVLIHEGGQQTTKGTVDINSCEGDLEGSAIKRIVAQLDDAVDLVISGHTHAAYVCQIGNGTGRKVLVTSALSYGRVLTSIDVTIDTATKKVTGITARNMVVDRNNAGITADAKIKAIVDHYAALAAPIANRVVGTITADITTTEDPSGESPLGDLIADAQLEATQPSNGAVVALMNSGGIRTKLLYSPGITGVRDGDVTYSELFAIQPFGNSLVTMTMTGAQLKTLLEEQFKGCALDFPAGSEGRLNNLMLQVSGGFTYAWNPAGATCDKVDASSMKIGGAPVVATQKYRVTANSFLANGGGQFYEFTYGTERVDGAQDLDALTAFFDKHRSISPNSLKRINATQEHRP
jgi:5'-nucleotidase